MHEEVEESENKNKIFSNHSVLAIFRSQNIVYHLKCHRRNSLEIYENAKGEKDARVTKYCEMCKLSQPTACDISEFRELLKFSVFQNFQKCRRKQKREICKIGVACCKMRRVNEEFSC